MSGFWTNLFAFLAKTAPYWGLFVCALWLSLMLLDLAAQKEAVADR